jgi:DNA-binding MarR family transcriptional regulator
MGLRMDYLDKAVSENIRIMAQAITEICQRSTLEKASPLPVNRNQFTILKILSNGGSFQISALARLLDISSAAVSKNIDRLSKLGMVSRRTNQKDRRRLEIILLEPGKNIVDQYDLILNEKQKHLMDQFSHEEKEVLLDMLKRVIKFTLAEEQDIDMICLQCAGLCGDSCVIESREGLCSLPKNNSGSTEIRRGTT